MKSASALVILSGGQDSATCALFAKRHYSSVHGITFNYGQRHIAEIQSAIDVAEHLGMVSHEVLDMGPVLKGSSPLVSNEPLGKYESIGELPGGIEPTFVYGRNILFLTIAANRAAVLGITDIFIGVCEADYGGYPDCRADFIESMGQSLSLGLYGEPDKLKIHTPLMHLTKAQTVLAGIDAAGFDLFYSTLALTHTCYDGVKGGCGKCHACHIRDRGFREAGMPDPIWAYRPNA